MGDYVTCPLSSSLRPPHINQRLSHPSVMPAARALRPNIFVILILIGVLLLLGTDRFVEIVPLRSAAVMVYEWGWVCC
jgi:hypothetical protein